MADFDLVREKARNGALLARSHASLAAARGLVALDVARGRRVGAVPTGVRAEPADLRPSGVLVAVAHWRSPSSAPASEDFPQGAGDESGRASLLAECIESLLGLDADRVLVAVLTNEPRQAARHLSAHFAGTSNPTAVSTLANDRSLRGAGTDGNRVVTIGWRPTLRWRHGFYLTWAHKALFGQALSDPGFSHFVYLEDDLRFTRESLAYWCRFREPLALFGLLPGFVRYEVFNGDRYVVDQARRQNLYRPSVVLSASESGRTSGPDLRFVNLDNPYQGMYVLDRGLAIDHLRNSPARSPLRSRTESPVPPWEQLVRERAAMGPIFDNVPSGFISRNVVPVLDLG